MGETEEKEQRDQKGRGCWGSIGKRDNGRTSNGESYSLNSGHKNKNDNNKEGNNFAAK